MDYLIDEAIDMGKGSNAIVSMLHHFFVHHGLDEKIVHLHADNWWAKQKRDNGPVPALASHDQPAIRDHPIIYDPRTHKVQPRLVLWTSEEVPVDNGGRTH